MEGSFRDKNDERAQILRMVEDGALSASDAVTLLDRLSERRSNPNAAAAATTVETEDASVDDFSQEELPPQPRKNGDPQWLRVRVTDLASGRSKVSVNIPFVLASWGLRAGARFNPQVEGVDLAELNRLVHEGGAQGLLVDVVDEEDGEHVQVFVE